MINLFLEILIQVTGFLSIVVFPLSTLLLKIVDKIFSKTEAESERSAKSPPLSTNPINTVPPWLKDIANINEPKYAQPVIENIEEPHINTQIHEFNDEKTTSSLAREVFFVKEEPKEKKETEPQPKTKNVEKELEKKKLTLEDLLAERIKNAQFRILLKLPPKAKLRVLGRDWEVDTENTFIEISTVAPQVVLAQNKTEQIEEIEAPKEPWKLPEKQEKEETEKEVEEELEEEDWELEDYG
ncbi:MAG TPA: hypothetical protein ENF63_00515 [Candidatus Bathyarchaeota archaeon]|nr:hypothetical protein [Candidatus Bathyarchaeota archaeon]